MTPAKRRRKAASDGHLRALDNTVVAIPLLEKLAEDRKRKTPRKHDVIIEINLLHSIGRIEIKNKVTELVTQLAGRGAVQEALSADTDQYVFATLTAEQIRELARKNEKAREVTDARRSPGSADVDTRRLRLIYKIWPDFPVDPLLTESVSTVKADAALAAFSAAGHGIVWAVIDTGIDGKHTHFQLRENLVLHSPLSHCDFTAAHPGPIPFEELRDDNGHGTHVAGVIAGEVARHGQKKKLKALRRGLDEREQPTTEIVDLEAIRGIAPRAKLVSLKVADAAGRIRTSRIIAALGYVRRINGDGRLPLIHGVNISLGHSFDPEWFGCGQSPLCVEVDRLVRAGTVVVVAAGNGGYGTLTTKFKGTIEAGLANTIRDPGNASKAITVGSTHRDSPHVYGVSYFSSKGPTGDGRLKPDLVAPGEKIVSCAANVKTRRLGYEYDERSGTSMAAPHVSGCVAAFLSIRREFVNQPERVKEIFLSTATDLGRERYFQGSGLVDLMRAIQSI